MSVYKKEDLINLKARHDAFVGIDSDGCVFPTMEIKQKKCFHMEIIKQWKLEKIETYVREAAEFVNLYSKWRGVNRFPALLRTFDLLLNRPEVRQAGVSLPALKALQAYVDSGVPLSNTTLKQVAEKTGDPELKQVLDWSNAVNARIERTVKNVPPFKWARETLEKLVKKADIIVVSQTPEEALIREWKEHGIDKYIAVIAGQELGTKGEHLAMATGAKYGPHRILMIGDAPGDRKAAQAVNALFFPINPGHEEASWKEFYQTGCDRFLNGTFDQQYQADLIARFEALLPDKPSWKTV